jgi:phosphinothricin acetyltransferase
MVIRKAEIKDIDSIDTIYNQAIYSKYIVADLTPWTPKKRIKWFEDHNNNYPIFVAEKEHDVIGYITISPYRPGRMALKQTAEISYFIDENNKRKGIAKKLIAYVESKCSELGIKTLFAIIIDCNKASIGLIEKCGYTIWGHLPNIAVFDVVEVGHLYYGKRIIA